MSKLYKTNSDRVFDIINTTMLVIILLIVLYPLYFVVIGSISDPNAVRRGEAVLYPVMPSLDGYRQIFLSSSIWKGYSNTIMYTVVGTTINVVLTLLAGYALSRKKLAGRNIIMLYLVFTMYFSGGLIPLFMLINGIGLYNTPSVMILPGVVSVFNIIIARSFFVSSIPDSLLEAAEIDGCGDFTSFIKVVLPLSKAITAVLALYYAVGHWNAFFNALIFLSNTKLYPLQLVLRGILIQNQKLQIADTSDVELLSRMEQYADLIKYGLIVVSSLPVLIAYPFAQKYFIKGVMIGSLKG